mgnify:CR=1 FL=1
MARTFLQLDLVWWRSAQVRRLSSRERDKLIDLLFLMNQSDEIGVLVTGGAAWSSEEAALSLGLTDADSVVLIDRLIGLDAIQRDDAGRIVCSWMVAKERKRIQGIEFGQLTPHKTKRKPKGNPSGDPQGHPKGAYVYDSVSDSPGVKEEGGAGGVSAKGGDQRQRTERDFVWDAIALEFYGGKVPGDQKPMVGKAVTGFIERGIGEGNTGEIHDRHERMRKSKGDNYATLNSLLKHWYEWGPNRIDEVSPSSFGAQSQNGSAQDRARERRAAKRKREYAEDDTPLPMWRPPSDGDGTKAVGG